MCYRVNNCDIDTLIVKRDKLSETTKIANDSINAVNIRILQLKTNSDIAGEIGPLKYLSELTGAPMNRVVNWFTILLIIIFDPLAVALVIVLNNIMKPIPHPAENVSKPDDEQEVESKAKRVKAPTPPAPLKEEPKKDIYKEEKKKEKPKRRNAYWT